MLPDPLVFTYDGVSKSLPRTNVTKTMTRYETPDGDLRIKIWRSPAADDTGRTFVRITCERRTPDPTPSDVFDPYRDIINSFELGFCVDKTRHEADTVLPLLRSALTTFVDTTMMNRLIAGES